MIDQTNTFPADLKSARAAAGLTQQGMSDALGIPKRNIEDWETVKSAPPEWAQRLILDKLAQIAADKP